MERQFRDRIGSLGLWRIRTEKRSVKGDSYTFSLANLIFSTF
jgi:hypothetical protein